MACDSDAGEVVERFHANVTISVREEAQRRTPKKNSDNLSN
jgi:hypothetical protein